ncbi:cytochrome c-type biogenesis protein [Aquicoccus porphyridii]|uniref:Cytochrome c-type biogenesis protein n=1 Tax=Aquicoccus porphyridii TaxID=1852029 RepID=A0A5A9ZU79_9RHOB|nr:cytochrome c-type biogenesis protein [Aquicoccus porphyridii]KAA0920874.1 cytochrome c-type biogenesis protein CcmH [Aquicoccus porphyridii]RAI56584.1 cytochrome C biogenesis protein CcdA [Rhodobacteraceae bacterium AsT-22]
MRNILLILVLLAQPVYAVQPDEMLDDPALEARAREVSKDLRCLVCRNESIDDSNAELARDMRLLVRERIVEGDSNEEVKEFLVSRYGEYVLLKPRFGGSNWILWGAGPGMLLFAGIGGMLYLRSRSRAKAPGEASLSDDEAKRLEEIMNR